MMRPLLQSLKVSANAYHYLLSVISFRPLKNFLPTMLIVSVMISCSENDTTTKTPSSISFVQESQSVFKGSADLTFQITDDNNIVNAKLYVDGLIIEMKPITGTDRSVSFQWDSKTVSDGNHEIKIVFENISGKTTEQTYTIHIRNNFLNLFIPAGYITGTNKLWIYLSDHAGHVLETKEGHNNTKLEFRLEDFADSTVIVSVFHYFDESANFLVRSTTDFTYVKSGDYNLSGVDSQNSTHPVSQGNAMVTITGMTDGYEGYSAGTAYDLTDGHYVDANSYSVTLELYKLQTNALIILHHSNGSAKCKMIKNVGVNGNMTLPLSDFTDMEHKTMSAAGIDTFDEFEAGFDQSGNEYIYNDDNNYESTESVINVYEPHLFSKYIGSTTEWINNVSNFYFTYGPSPHTAFKKSNAELLSYDFTNNKIQANMVGGASYLIGLYGSTGSMSGDRYVSDAIAIHIPFHAQTNFIQPPVPDEIIQQLYPDGAVAIPFDNLSVEEDVSGKATYYDDVYAWLKTEAPRETINEIAKTFMITGGSSGGRMQTPKNINNLYMLRPSYRKIFESLQKTHPK
jgi:hypothetical protein